MKYYRLHIDSKGNSNLYSNITKIMGVKPMSFNKNEDFSLWTLGYDESEDSQVYDFINEFLDLIESKLMELARIGVSKDDITIWLNYEYDLQCSLEFHPKGMERLGRNGINLCIDCFQTDKIKYESNIAQ